MVVSRLWMRLAAAVLILALLLGSAANAAASGPGQSQGVSRLHPKLAALAASSPNNPVDVIVVKAPNADETAIVNSAGGKRLKSWPFINAIHLSVPAATLPGLAQNPAVRYIAPDPKTVATGLYDPLMTTGNYQAALISQNFWDYNYLGDGIGVAVLDSGVAAHPDLTGQTVNVVLPSAGDWTDPYGHGTHVAGIIAGSNPDMAHVGIAPKATIYNLRVADETGSGRESDLISALEWVFNNHATYNIRVVNISMQSSVSSSYLTSPLDGAVERLWFDGVAVVVSAGNLGPTADAASYPPANDPYVITVGAMDDNGTKEMADDTVVSWSSSGVSQDGFAKPDLLAPGRHIISTLSPGSVLANNFPDQVSGQYLSISGSSMAAPVIAGAVADILQYRPTMVPDQVKYLLLNNSRSTLQGQTSSSTPTPALDKVFNTLTNTEVANIPSANQGLTPSTYSDSATSFSALNVYYENVYYETSITPNNIYLD